jgi:hypothetical protein
MERMAVASVGVRDGKAKIKDEKRKMQNIAR